MSVDGIGHQVPNTDPGETGESLDSFDVVVYTRDRPGRYLLERLLECVRYKHVEAPYLGPSTQSTVERTSRGIRLSGTRNVKGMSTTKMRAAATHSRCACEFPGLPLRLRIAVVIETVTITPKLMNIIRNPMIVDTWFGSRCRQALLAAGLTAPIPKPVMPRQMQSQRYGWSPILGEADMSRSPVARIANPRIMGSR